MNEPIQGVRNAADPRQVRAAADRDKRKAQRVADAFHFVASSAQGREFLWELIGYCKTHESIWHPSAAIHYNAGVQDVGHYLEKMFNDHEPHAFISMMQEALKRREASEGETKSAQSQTQRQSQETDNES